MDADGSMTVPKDRLMTIRELSGYSLENAAKRFRISQDALKQIEMQDKLTAKQLSKFAEAYKRPLAAFFSEAPPTQIHKLADHRINREKELSPGIYTAERRAYFMINKIAGLSNGKSRIPSAPEGLSAVDLAKWFRKELSGKGIELLKQSTPTVTLQYYKDAIEKLFFVSVIEYPLKSSDVRAFCMPDELSVIVLNESDKQEVKLFSLFHEMCHLVRKSGSLCSFNMDLNQKGSEEGYCDTFSAEVLVPRDDFQKETYGYREKLDSTAITKLSKLYSVSRQVIGFKLYLLDFLTKDQYMLYTTGSRKKPKKSKGGFARDWNKVFHNRVGNLALNEVKSNYSKKNISLMEAVGILDVNTKYADKLLEG